MGKVILLTGGTGFIGSHIAAQLLKEGHYVYFLARSNRRLQAEDRIRCALRPICLPSKKHYQVLEVDLRMPLYTDVPGIDEVWHCAASLSFKKEDRRETFAVNFTGTRNLLEFMKRSGIQRLHHLSTAYISGERGGLLREDELDCGQKFHNPYEESKLRAEQLVYRWSEETGGRFTIYRPSVIVGNSRTGSAAKCHGYYTCARYFFALKQWLRVDIRKDAHRYEGSGIQTRGTHLHLPLSFPGRPETFVNILPVDVAVRAILRCSNACGNFHITNAQPIPLERLLQTSLAVMGISGVTIGTAPVVIHPMLLHLNSLLRRAVRHFQPYAAYGSNSPRFDQTNTMRVLGAPLEFKITEEFLCATLNYAQSKMQAWQTRASEESKRVGVERAGGQICQL